MLPYYAILCPSHASAGQCTYCTVGGMQLLCGLPEFQEQVRDAIISPRLMKMQLMIADDKVLMYGILQTPTFYWLGQGVFWIVKFFIGCVF